MPRAAVQGVEVVGARRKCLIVLLVDEEIPMRPASPLNLGRVKAKLPASELPEIIRAKYKLRILWDLQQGSRRFGEIRKRLSWGTAETKEVAARVLSRELKSLVEMGLLHRRVYEVIPPKVEYRLTALGRSLLPVISKILEWGTRHPSPRRAGKRLPFRPIGIDRHVAADLDALPPKEAFYAGGGN